MENKSTRLFTWNMLFLVDVSSILPLEWDWLIKYSAGFKSFSSAVVNKARESRLRHGEKQEAAGF